MPLFESHREEDKHVPYYPIALHTADVSTQSSVQYLSKMAQPGRLHTQASMGLGIHSLLQCSTVDGYLHRYAPPNRRDIPSK